MKDEEKTKAWEKYHPTKPSCDVDCRHYKEDFDAGWDAALKQAEKVVIRSPVDFNTKEFIIKDLRGDKK